MDDFTRLVGAEAAWRRLSDRGLLRVGGADRVRFLSGMLSNDVAALAPGHASYGTQLDRKGHVLADLWVLATDDAILLDTAPRRAQVVLEMLRKHIVADDVEVEDRSASWHQLAFEGPGARSASAAPELAADGLEIEASSGLVWLAGGSLTTEGVRLLGPRELLDARALPRAVPELSSEHAEILRVRGFRPAYGVDVGERNFPAEARLDHAVSLTKGCFVGQEIVARIHARGAVNRLLVQLGAESPVAVGADIATAAGGAARPTGRVTSAVHCPDRGALALGYVKSADAEPGTALSIDGVAAVVLGPPFDDAA